MNDDKRKGVYSFEEKHLISIMMFLSVNRECRKIEIYENVTSNPRIPEKLDKLESLGLITQSRVRGDRFTTVKITEKGIKVVEHLTQIDEITKTD